MEISEKLLKFKFHISIAVAFSLAIGSLIYVAPRFLDVLAYFWPLLLSTALFLVAVIVFNKATPLATEAPCEMAGEVLLDFVACPPEVLQHPAGESSKSEDAQPEAADERSKSEENM
ncbi:uncharacterized protein LOC127810959 [Diospyros lotus]|uniref:uncharacterized protein LOC127810959 n=1 Tax=Diospyros lotus TaxID=55363 RepID=UPI0022503496|nr:uncharacterized protein LOC127810959 [Diospyros lotus]